MDEKIVHQIRSFNRNYVRTIGLLENTILNTGYSLTEAHILNEVTSQPNSTATSINKELKLDEGYLSRVIKRLISKSLITKKQSLTDKRVYVINPTDKGKTEYQKLDILSSQMVIANIDHLKQEEQLELVALLDRVQLLLKKQ
ncbi:MarR family winged helix-turn-helix transcriptional regulator [Flavobacterium sp. WC2421]|jgi:DNA-binding MarR family transcriptional regulator|uniref:MarR family winged helix-turn-helix transcriptional regulator n=3 Tax=unclassified Flavobacterium TaxID=196869 RepID=A0AB39WA99_9FLAO|tara:strand:- start:188 stop:616 length:429 start_codon:yes stop_codon:yes gene_type:complete